MAPPSTNISSTPNDHTCEEQQQLEDVSYYILLCFIRGIVVVYRYTNNARIYYWKLFLRFETLLLFTNNTHLIQLKSL